MSMVSLLKAFIDADLSKSQLTMGLTLLMQTAGYGKPEDDLSDSRLEQLSGLRRDRARTAVNGITGMGLFEIAGKGKFGTVYRIPERFLGGSGYIGFSANIGVSETDAYAEITEDKPETASPEYGEAYQNLVETNRMLVEANQVLVNTNQSLVETNRNLVNALPSLGGQLTKTGLNGYQDLVTDSNKPKHNKTTTTLTNTPEEIPEQWPEHWGQIRQGDGEGNSQVLENHAATPTPPQPIGTTGCGINADTLQYPEALTAEEHQEAQRKLDGLHPQVAQDVLDALAWMMANGRVKKSNIGLLVCMANKAREGTFDCTPALEWRKRQQDAQIKQSRITTVELNNLATEIKEIQRLHKESGQAMFLQQAEAMKVEYFQKLEAYKASQDQDKGVWA